MAPHCSAQTGVPDAGVVLLVPMVIIRTMIRTDPPASRRLTTVTVVTVILSFESFAVFKQAAYICVNFILSTRLLQCDFARFSLSPISSLRCRNPNDLPPHFKSKELY